MAALHGAAAAAAKIGFRSVLAAIAGPVGYQASMQADFLIWQVASIADFEFNDA